MHELKMLMTKKEANNIVGGLSETYKMPCKSYNIPAELCITGSKLRKINNSVCSDCYACKGRYNFGNVQNALRTVTYYYRHLVQSTPISTPAMITIST